MKHTITFYEDMKFTVNDGPARDVMDPANRAFMQAIGEGVCPQELEGDGSRPVEVNLVRKHEEYKVSGATGPPRAPFRGVPRRTPVRTRVPDRERPLGLITTSASPRPTPTARRG